jgi:hypothetical protein
LLPLSGELYPGPTPDTALPAGRSGRYIQAKSYLKQLDAAVRLLGRDDANRYITGAFVLDPAKIKTVQDLVAFMGDKALRFAPAVPGDEAAYVALHRALASASRGGGESSLTASPGSL